MNRLPINVNDKQNGAYGTLNLHCAHRVPPLFTGTVNVVCGDKAPLVFKNQQREFK